MDLILMQSKCYVQHQWIHQIHWKYNELVKSVWPWSFSFSDHFMHWTCTYRLLTYLCCSTQNSMSRTICFRRLLPKFCLHCSHCWSMSFQVSWVWVTLTWQHWNFIVDTLYSCITQWTVFDQWVIQCWRLVCIWIQT